MGIPVQHLMGAVKVMSDNLRILHRNIVGEHWFAEHEKFDEYYQYMDKLQDDVIEMGLMLDYTEPNIVEASKCYPCIPGKKYSIREAYEFTYNFFNDLIKIFQECEADVPSDVYSKFEEYILYLRMEANYKIKRLLK